MKLWISKNSEVPIQEQLATQLILGIVSADLAPGERLPSTTALARRFQVHPNTVRASYRDLVERGWLEWRRGSGFYVRELSARGKLDPSQDLDYSISIFLETAKSRGHRLSDVQSRIARWFSRQKPDRILVIEPDPELREILVAEISEATTLPIAAAGFEEVAQPGTLVGAFCVALYDHAEDLRSSLPPEVECLLLRSRSIARSLFGRPRPEADTLITVVSRWPDFLQWTRTTLVAVGLDPESLDIRDARKKGWDRGLSPRSFIVTDSLTARRLPAGSRPQVFRIIADKSLIELKKKLQDGFPSPAA